MLDKSFKKEISEKEFKEIKVFKVMVWCAFWFYMIIILGSILGAYNDNHDNLAPQAFEFNGSEYASETKVALYTLFYKHSNELPHVRVNKGYLLLYVLFLCGSYLLAFRSAIKFLGTFDTANFRISLKSAKYLTNLGDSLIAIFISLIFTGQVYDTLYKWSPEVIYFDYSKLGDPPIVLLLVAIFIRIIATLLKRSAELQEEVDATV